MTFPAPPAGASGSLQMNVFDGVAEELRRVQQMLSATDINTLTPVEALLKLAELKGL